MRLKQNKHSDNKMPDGPHTAIFDGQSITVEWPAHKSWPEMYRFTIFPDNHGDSVTRMYLDGGSADFGSSFEYTWGFKEKVGAPFRHPTKWLEFAATIMRNPMTIDTNRTIFLGAYQCSMGTVGGTDGFLMKKQGVTSEETIFVPRSQWMGRDPILGGVLPLYANSGRHNYFQGFEPFGLKNAVGRYVAGLK